MTLTGQKSSHDDAQHTTTRQTPILASTVVVARDKGGALGTKGGEDIVEIIATCISLRKLARLDIVDYSHSACLFILVLF